MRFRFDIRKATAAAAYLCSQNGGSLNLLHLIKMLYAADRMALLKWHRTITGDKFVAMKHGPVLSRIYDLIQGKAVGHAMEVWSACFLPRSGNAVSLRSRPDFGPLSTREMDALRSSFEQFRNIPAGRLIEYLHEVLPEWSDPGDSSRPIDPIAILRHAGLTEDRVARIEREVSFAEAAKRAFQAV